MEEETEMFQGIRKDSEWVTENYEHLRKYENKVIAIRNKEIIGLSDSLEDLLKELREKKENPAFLLIEAIPPRDAAFIL